VSLRWFECPDGSIKPVEECLAGCNHRCLTLPTLVAIAEERVWNGVPSTTQLLNGTMMEFLKLTKDYGIDPQSRIFPLLGTRHHQKLELKAKEVGLLSEIALSPDGRDVFDLLEPTSTGWTLTDYKTWGSYRVQRALGLVGHRFPDPSGAVYKTSGKWGKAGTPKWISEFTVDPNAVDLWDAELQLNRYRVMLEDRGLVVTDMQVQITVRDGGLKATIGKGIEFNAKLLPIRMLDNDYVRQYFARKEKALLLALEIYHEHDSTFLPTPCDGKESWEDRRCQGYCDVSQHCPKGMLYGGNK